MDEIARRPERSEGPAFHGAEKQVPRFAQHDVLFYDGDCGVCARSVQFVLTRERSNASKSPIRFATLQGDHAKRLRATHPELTSIDSVVWLDTNGRVLVRSDAVIAVLRYVGGWWRFVAAALRAVPRFVRDRAYDLVARNRFRVRWRDTTCLVPTPEQRRRFLD